MKGTAQRGGARADPDERLKPYWPWLLILGGALLVWLANGQVLQHGFTYDDHQRIRQLDGEAVRPLAQILAPRGLTRASRLLDHALWGTDPLGYHLTNLILQWLATLLAGWLALALTGRVLPALLTAFLFAVHPVHVEVVALFANRKDLLAFCLICCCPCWSCWISGSTSCRRGKPFGAWPSRWAWPPSPASC